MIRAKRISARYIKADKVQVQGDHRAIEPYLNKGYNIITSANGNWVLARNAKVYVTMEGEDGSIYTYNMRMQILEFYGRVKISENLVNEFLKNNSQFTKKYEKTIFTDKKQDGFFICKLHKK